MPTGGEPHRYFLGRMTMALARFKSLRVIALPASVAGSDATRSIRELAANYVVLVSPCPRTGSLGVTVNLVDGDSGLLLWAAAFEDIDDETIEDSVAASIDSEVQSAETMRSPRHRPGSEAYDFYLRGRRALNSSRAADNRVAYSLFTSAIALEPENPAYLAAATEAMHHRMAVGWEALGPDDKQVCRELAYRTLAVAGSDAVALALVGNALFTADEEDLGLAIVRRALALNPTSPLVLACALHAEGWAGSMEEQERLSRFALGLAPNDPAQRFALGGMATAALWRGDNEGALAWSRQALAFGPGYAGAHLPMIDGLVRLGRAEQAERHLARYLAMSPGFTIRSFERGQHHADRSRLRPGIESLRRAGAPER
jgi:tetratricopeptide (TPR) repeat protein